MTGHALLSDNCRWVGHRTHHPTPTVGDKVTLCTAQRVWTITSVHGHEATITAPGIPQLTAHIAHIERVDTDPDEHGEIPGQEALDLGDAA